MSKYTRLNKINHYHDSGSKNPTTQDSRMKPPLIKMLDNNNNNSSRRMINNRRGDRKSSSSPLLAGGIVGGLPRGMDNTVVKLALFAFISILVVMLVCVNGVYTLNCYHCSSVNNPECDEAFTGKANFTETNCEKYIEQPAKVCRKIVQYIEHKKVVIRSCGYVDEREEKDRKPMCYKRSGTFAIMMESCNCYTDNCNHSASLVPNRSVLLLTASYSVLILLYYYINHNMQSIING